MAGTTKEVATATSPSTEVETLQAQIAELTAENASLKEDLKQASEFISELKGQAKSGSQDVTVKLEGKTYLVVKGFKDKEKSWLPEDIAANPKKAAELLTKGSTILKLKD
jgi:DNA-binding protein YbaB